MDQQGSLTRRHVKTRLSPQLPIRLDIQPLKLAAKDSAAQGVELKRVRTSLCGLDIGFGCLTRVMCKSL
jgi:hypothetical protein